MKQPFVFTHSVNHRVTLPHSVSKAVDILVSIANRNDTPKIVGNRSMIRPNFCVPIVYTAMQEILGTDIGVDYPTAMQNPAFADYYARVCDRLFALNFTLAFSRSYWYLVRISANATGTSVDPYAYDMLDFTAQQPAGVGERVNNRLDKSPKLKVVGGFPGTMVPHLRGNLKTFRFVNQKVPHHLFTVRDLAIYSLDLIRVRTVSYFGDAPNSIYEAWHERIRAVHDFIARGDLLEASEHPKEVELICHIGALFRTQIEAQARGDSVTTAVPFPIWESVMAKINTYLNP